MTEHDQQTYSPEEEKESAFNLGNFLFGFLGAWCAVIVCLMVYEAEAQAPGSREPAQEVPNVPAVPQPKTPSEDFEPSAYLLSFNSIHLEK